LSNRDYISLSVIHHISDGIILMDAKGLITMVNPAAVHLFGYSPSEIIGQPITKLIPDLYSHHPSTGQPRMIGIGRKAMGRRQDGTAFSMIITVTESNINGEKQFTGIIRDFAERKLRELLGKLVDEMVDEVYLFDTSTMRIAYVNETSCQNLGRTSEELLQLNWFDLTPSFTEESLSELIEPLLLGEEKRLKLEAIHQRKDGSSYPVEIYLQFSYSDLSPVLIATAQDITQRKEMEKAQQMAERYLLYGKSIDR
jgi:PAS domain S-box-containing protein